MARTVRIDDVRFHDDGRVEVLYTVGQAPLSATPGGQGALWSSREALMEAVRQAEEEQLTHETLLLLLTARWFKRDPDLKDTLKAKGSVTVDLAGAVDVLRFG